MPINERQAEQPGPQPSIAGLAWPSSGDEPSGAGLSPAHPAAEPKRAGLSHPISSKDALPAEYLVVTGGGWVPPRDLMDLCADGKITAPSATALEMVSWVADDGGPAATYQLLLATAITLLEQESIARKTVRYATAISQLVDAGRDGVLALVGAADRSNEARPFA